MREVLLGRHRFLRGSLAMAGVGLVSGCRSMPSWTAQPSRLPHVGWLILGFSGPPGPLMQALSSGLSEHGYVEGHTILVDPRFAEGREERLRDLADELVSQKVDAILAGSQAAGFAAKTATTTVPIIVVLTGDPVELGLVTSLARPGGNITGLTADELRLRHHCEDGAGARVGDPAVDIATGHRADPIDDLAAPGATGPA